MTTSMKQSALMALVLCVQSVAGLECMACNNSACSSQSPVKCYWGETLCYSKITEESHRHLNITQMDTWLLKGCDSSGMCTSTESHYISYQTGTESRLSNTTCCGTDNCNTANASLSPPADSLRCYGCNPWTLECTANLTCNALERCFKALIEVHDGPQALHGCVSENLCSNANLSRQYLGPITSFSCCNTSHCNTPEQEYQCIACTDTTCSSQRSVLCSTPMCYSYAHSSSYSHPEIMKGCAPPSVCETAGSHFISHQLKDDNFLLNITCCNDTNCNTVDPDIAPPGGSLQCYSCDHSLDNCTHVTCNGLEVCSNTTFEDFRFYGCVSENLCNNLNLSRHFFGFRTELSCCNTTNCNVPPNATAPSTSTPTADPWEDEDCSVFCSAGRVLPPGLSLLGLCIVLGWPLK